jgi:hypothetical protein
MLLRIGGFAREIKLASKGMKSRIQVRTGNVRFDTIKLDKAPRQSFDEFLDAITIGHCSRLHSQG